MPLPPARPLRPRRAGPARLAAPFLALLFCALVAASTSDPSPLFDRDRLERDTRRIAADPHRLAGTPEFEAAADHVRQRLEEIGVETVFEQRFLSAQTETIEAEIELLDEAGDTLAALPLFTARPNGVIPATTPADGLEGELVYAGRGRPGDFPKPATGAIVVLDYNSFDGWRRAFRQGAKAVVFLADDDPDSGHAKHAYAPANLPRFYFEGDKRALLEAHRARVKAAEVWRNAVNRNLIAYIPGSDPEFYLEAPETIVVSAALDSFGEIPRRAPGARGAANAAAMLQWIRHFKEHPPRRNLLFVFWENDARGHAGAQAFFTALAPANSRAALDKREAYHRNEVDFFKRIEKALALPNPIEIGGSTRRELITRLRRIADRQTAENLFERGQRRLETDSLPDEDPRLPQLEAAIDELDEARAPWNELKRALANFEITPAAEDPYRVALARVAENAQKRQQELAILDAHLADSRRIKDLIGGHEIVLHVSLMTGDATPRWGLLLAGHSRSILSEQDEPGLYAHVQFSFLDAYEALQRKGRPADTFEVQTADGSLVPHTLFSGLGRYSFSGAVAGKLGIHNIALATAQEAMPREGAPGDTAERLDYGNIAAQHRDMIRMMDTLASQDGLSRFSAIPASFRYAQAEFGTDDRRQGPVALSRARGSMVADTPVAGAMLMVTRRFSEDPDRGPLPYEPHKIPAFDDFFIVRSNQEGGYSYGPFANDMRQSFAFAAAFDERGQADYASTFDERQRSETRVTLFPSKSGRFVPPPQFASGSATVFDAESDSQLDVTKSNYFTWDGFLYLHYEDKIDRVKAFGEASLSALNLKAVETVADAEAEAFEAATDLVMGEGYQTHPAMPPVFQAGASARDLVNLNGFRLDLLRSKGVFNASIDEIHGRSSDLLAEADAEADPAAKEAKAASAYLLQRIVYDYASGTLGDLVKAVIALLLLAIPFAFAAERLLVGAPTIYRQVVGFIVFFVAAFLLLYWTHPAFAVSATPMIIFLGFVIVLLACLVIVIIMQKFETELKALQGMSHTAHTVDVSRLGTLMAAMSMGISTMRRRPLRTALTAATIVLLTFTLLTFASFGQTLGIVKVYYNPAPPYAAAQVFDTGFRALSPSVVDLLRGRYGEEAEVAPRLWITPEDDAQLRSRQGVLVSDEAVSRSQPLSGVVGLSAAELASRADWRGLLQLEPGESAEGKLWVTESIAARLGLQPGDAARIGGRRVTLGPLIDATRFIRTTDMSGMGVLPVDLASYEARQRSAETDELGESQSWKFLTSDAVAVASDELVRDLGGRPRMAHVYADTPDQAARIAEEMAALLQTPVLATRSDGVYRHVFGSVVQASGLSDILLPIVLGGLVIFGTMLGSVADREKEIYTFSALGLAPPHVASLFFAEALVYSILGGLGGYFFSQLVNKALIALAERGFVAAPEMNYSSFNAVATLVVVMLVVLLSSVYPALKASRSANPGVMRNWKLPQPEGDRLEMTFPFTVSAYDITGVISFLKEHFGNYTDTGLGNFMTMESAYLADERGRNGLRVTCAVAPFDLGVTQTFELTSAPSEIPGINEVKVKIQRLSGQPKDWARLNKTLVDDLRRQFLIWRALPKEQMEEYRARTLEADAEAASHPSRHA